MNEIYTDYESVVEEQPKIEIGKTNTKTVFSTGAVRDSGEKEDYVETISYLALQRFAAYMTSKQATYGKGNWRKGIPIESYEKSLMRHLQKYFANKYDGASLEPQEDHLSAALFNLQGLLHEEEKRRTSLVSEQSTTEFRNTTVSGSLVLASLPTKSEAISVEVDIVRNLREKGYTIAEIAALTGVSERTVYRRLAGGN